MTGNVRFSDGPGQNQIFLCDDGIEMPYSIVIAKIVLMIDNNKKL